MSVDQIMTRIATWTAEDSRRGQFAREFMANEGDDPTRQAERLGVLSMFFTREARRIARAA